MSYNSLSYNSLSCNPLSRRGISIFIVASVLFAMATMATLPSKASCQMADVPLQVEEDDKGVLKKPYESLHSSILKYRGIEPTVESIGEYLKSLQPDHPSQQKLAETSRKLIDDLGNESYRVRQGARVQLGKMTTLPIEQLKDARESKDPEVRASAAMLLQYSKKRSARDSRDGITRAACTTIVERELKGLVGDLTKTSKLFSDDESTLKVIREAIIASVVPDDVKILTEMISQEQQSLRITGIRGLANLQKESSADVLTGLLDDTDESIVLAAARELANLGQRDSVAALMKLLESKELSIRIAAHRVVRSVTNKNFKYYAFEKPELRAAAIKRWSDWLKDEGEQAKLHFPLVEKRIVLGRILLSDYSASKVIELDMEGKVVWEKEVTSPWAVQGLPNGHRLVGLYTESAIVEFDTKGEEVGRIEKIPGNVMGFCRLENGNTLVTGSESGKILEYDSEGKVIWEKTIGGRPTDIKALENGNMIVSLMDESRIVEINREGERINTIQVEASPMQVQVTERGTFITAHSSLQFAPEYDATGEEIRKIEIDKAVTGAREMSNGDMILATSDAIQRQSADGTVIWEYKDLTYCYNVSPY